MSTVGRFLKKISKMTNGSSSSLTPLPPLPQKVQLNVHYCLTLLVIVVIKFLVNLVCRFLEAGNRDYTLNTF